MENLYDFYKESAIKFENEILFDNAMTYGEAFRFAELRALYLKKQGFKKNDSIALLAENSKEWCITYMAITMMGCIAIPMDPNLPKKSYSEMVKAVNAKGAFVSDIYKSYIPRLKKFSVDLSKSILKTGTYKPTKIKEDQIAAYVFTSGTTGKPKIVQLTHANVFKTSISTSTYLGLGPKDHFLNILPLFHAYAFVANFSGPFAKGSSFYFLRSLKGPDIVKTLSEQEFTVFPAAPQLWELFMDSILNKAKAGSKFKYNILTFFLNTAPFWKAVGLGFLPMKITAPIRDVFGKKMQFFISGGAPLKRKYFNYYNRMGLCVIEGYGLSETTGPISISHMEDNRAGSVGPPMPGNEVKIKNVNQDGIGEIWLKGNAVMPGYYKNKEANDIAFDENGWFKTGDLGRVDKDNYIYITGRNKNVIVLDSGKNVYPEELESYYKTCSEISEISIFGKKINGRENVYAVIVPEKKNDNSYNNIKSEVAKLNKGLPSYKVISGFSISFDPLPTNSTRKVLVHEVKANQEKGMYQDSVSDSQVFQKEISASNQKEEIIINKLKTKFKTDTIYANQTLPDFGIDSLGLIDLIVYLEENLSIEINSGEARELHTVQEFIEYLAKCPDSKGASLDDKILRNENVKKYHTFQNPISEIVIFTVKVLTRLFWKVEVEGRENFKHDNVVIAVNHQSNLDYPVLNTVVPVKNRRKMFVVGKKELSFLKFIFPGSNTIWVDRGGDVVPSLKTSADILRQGKNLCIFPEGTRSEDGELQPFKTGASYLAKNLDKIIIPVVINGTGEILPKGRFVPKFFGGRKIRIKVLEPIDSSLYKTAVSLKKKLESDMTKTLKEMK